MVTGTWAHLAAKGTAKGAGPSCTLLPGPRHGSVCVYLCVVLRIEPYICLTRAPLLICTLRPRKTLIIVGLITFLLENRISCLPFLKALLFYGVGSAQKLGTNVCLNSVTHHLPTNHVSEWNFSFYNSRHNDIFLTSLWHFLNSEGSYPLFLRHLL